MPTARVSKSRLVRPGREAFGENLSSLGGSTGLEGTYSLTRLGSAGVTAKESGGGSFDSDPFGTQAYFDQQQEGSLSRELFGSGAPDPPSAAETQAGADLAAEQLYRRFSPAQFLSEDYAPHIRFDPNTGMATYAPPGFEPVQFDASNFIPEEIRGIPGISTTPEEYFRYVRSFEGGVIPPEIYADIVQTESNRRDAEEGRQFAIGRIEGTADRLAGDREAFENDPDRQLVTDLLRERAENPQFSEAERAAAQNALSKAAAIADATARAEAGGRGVAGGGLQSSRNAGLSFATSSAGIGLSARFDAMNREAQDRAVSLLADFETSEDQLELAYSGQQGAVDQVLAALENDRPLAEIDFLAFEALEFGKQVYATNEAYRQATLEAFERSQEYDWPDFIDDFIGFMASGGAQALSGFLSKLSSPIGGAGPTL